MLDERDNPPAPCAPRWSRRAALATGLAMSAELLLPSAARGQAQASAPAPGRLRTRPIPHGAESLPVIGAGTAIVFDVGDSPADRAGCTGVVRALVQGGATLIDTAPSYGEAESVVGAILADTRLRSRVFLATKLERYERGREQQELAESLKRLRTDRVELLQLHNVRDPEQSLEGLRWLKAGGACRYTGITTTFKGAYAAAEAIIRREKPDFVEVDYALDNRSAEERLIPAAMQAGSAVLAALPFGRGRLFRTALGHPLPPWAADFDCHSWAQFFLKFILAHPAITAAIPGTDKAAHMTDDLGAALGRLPDAPMRERMVRYVESLG